MGQTPDSSSTIPASKKAPAGNTRWIRNWPVFKSGYWNGQYFSTEQCRQVVDNFHQYSEGDRPYLIAKGKLGHDAKQRFAKLLGLIVDEKGRTIDPETGEAVSAGMPALGRVVDMRLSDAGEIAVDIEGVPEPIWEMFENKQLLNASVELDCTIPDPNNANKKIPGYVLTAVAYLGDEKPGVAGIPPPVISFTANNPGGAVRIKFSEVLSMNRDQLISALKDKGIDIGADPALANLPDEALGALLKSLPATMVKLADDEDDKKPVDTNPEMSKRFSELEKTNAELSKKFTEVEKAFTDLQAKAGEIQNAAKFAKTYEQNIVEQKRDRATGVVNECARLGKIVPASKGNYIADLMLLSNDKAHCFAEGEHKDKTPFEAELLKLIARTPDPRFAAVPTETKTEGMSPERRAQLYNATETLRAKSRTKQTAS